MAGDVVLQGLSSAEAQQLAAQGLSNVDSSRQRTDQDVVRANALSFFNLVLTGLTIALIGVGEFRDALFVWIVTAANVAVSTWQEIRATRIAQSDRH